MFGLLADAGLLCWNAPHTKAPHPLLALHVAQHAANEGLSVWLGFPGGDTAVSVFAAMAHELSHVGGAGGAGQIVLRRR